MRALLLSALLVAAAVAGGDALAQGGRGKEKERPRAPSAPIMRCADLAIGDYTLGALAPNAAPLGEGEIAVRWEVRNAGGAPYLSPNSAQQWLALEYTTPSGPQQVSINPLPPTVASATPASAATSAGRPEPVSLAPGASWRGYLRATVPPEAARRPLRLRLGYAPRRGVANDCDMDNNTAAIQR